MTFEEHDKLSMTNDTYCIILYDTSDIWQVNFLISKKINLKYGSYNLVMYLSRYFYLVLQVLYVFQKLG